VLGGEKAQDFSTIMLKADAIAVGPGLGSRRKLAKQILNKLNAARTLSPVILDADGLNAFSGELTALAKYNLNLILTPHPGELARLLNVKTEIIQKNREKFARETARIIKGIVVLKGDQTVVADQTGQIYINQTGNPGLASGGIGDVLTGMIAGLCAQKVPAWEAAIAGVYLHGLAGDLAAKAKGEYSLIASDLVEKIPDAIQSLG
jgi:NAD(P)H-hydrate epimerase